MISVRKFLHLSNSEHFCADSNAVSIKSKNVLISFVLDSIFCVPLAPCHHKFSGFKIKFTISITLRTFITFALQMLYQFFPKNLSAENHTLHSSLTSQNSVVWILLLAWPWLFPWCSPLFHFLIYVLLNRSLCSEFFLSKPGTECW